jgi:excisionase family DNA binding protein
LAWDIEGILYNFRLRLSSTKILSMDKLLLRPVEAAEVISVGRSKVYELIASGDLPSIRIGASVRVPVDALKAWISQRVAGQ